jgi:cysteinyl-tRNA synthetase
MAALKQGSGFTRQVLSYLSIGEAEEYRYYFEPAWVSGRARRSDDSTPCWLGRRNPDWEGNYKVQYWSEQWQRIVLGYLDRIIDDGFDGVYLDIIDAFEYWSDPGNGEGVHLAEQEAAVRMINFVKRIACHARILRGKTDFLIIPQNGERLFLYDSGIDYLGRGDYLETISGMGVEDLYYDETSPVEPSITAERKRLLEPVRAAGKKVLVVDYVDEGFRPVAAMVSDFRHRAGADGYLPYAASKDRELDHINSFPGQP